MFSILTPKRLSLYCALIFAVTAGALLFSRASVAAGDLGGVRSNGSPLAPAGIRQISLMTKDLIYDPSGQRIYASLPGTAPNGNSLVQIEPVSGTVGTPVFVGSEPGKLAISNNSQYIYASLDGSAAVRRFDIATQIPDLQFNLGADSFFGPLYVDDMAVMPGQPTTIAVSRKYQGTSPRHAGVGIYDNGVVRPTTTATHTGSDVIEFSSSPSTLYGYNNETTEFGFRKMSINSSGVTVTSTTANIISGFGVDISYANGVIYSTTGRAINPETGTIIGTFSGIGFGSLVVPDSVANRVYFLTGSGSSTLTLKAYDATTFLQTGSLSISGVSGTPSSFLKWGSDGLAFRTSGNQIFLFSVTDIVALPATPLPTPVQDAPGIFHLSLTANDLVYDSNTQKVYASLPSSAGTFGNSLAPIDPTTAIVGTPIPIGSEPRKLALSANNQYIYAGIDGSFAVRKFDLASQNAQLQFSLGSGAFFTGPLSADDIAAVPGDPNAVAIARRNSGFSPRHEGVAIYDNGVARSLITGGNPVLNDVIEFGASPAKLYGYNNEATDFSFRRMIVNSSGVSVVSTASTAISGFGVDIKYDNGLVYASSGRVINPESGASVGTFSGANSLAFVPDSSVKRIYFVTGSGNSTTLLAFDTTTFLSTGSLSIPGVLGTPTNLIRWGSNGLAFCTSGNQVYFVQTSLIPGASLSSSTTTVTSSLNPSKFGQNVTFTATVSSNSGTPTGSVQFQDNGVNLGSPQTLSSGAATFASSSLPAGLHTITADYSGDNSFLVSGAVLVGGQTVLPLISINEQPITEGQTGTKTLNLTVSLSGPTTQTVTVDYATGDGTATAGSDYVATSGTLTFSPGQTSKIVSITINGDQSFEPDETFVVNLSNPANAALGIAQGTGSILNDDAMGGFISFSQGSYSATESAGLITVTINRSNDTSRAATVDYSTSDTGSPAQCATISSQASSHCDFTTAVGTLQFAPNETVKTFAILLNRDSYAENTETFGINLTNPTGGALITSSATVTGVIFNSSNPAGTPTNIVDDASFFVQQHYHDFLNREPDASGLAFWTNQITECQQPGATCNADVRRINVSAAFFLSIEFQETGYLVERLYKTSYGDATGTSNFGPTHQLAVPIVRFDEFLRDSQEISQGIVVGPPGWEQMLENNKAAFIAEFVQRSRFATTFSNSLTPAQFVDHLFANAGVVPTDAERNAAINEFGGAGTSADTAARARALRLVAENSTLESNEKNRAFVLMQYFGYLRRNPNEGQDTDYSGFDFWLTKLNQFNGNFVNAQMVEAFIVSGEYRARFGS